MLKKIKPIRLIVVIAIIATLCFFAWEWFKPKNGQPQYITEEVVRGNLENTVLATGTLGASKSLNVGAQVSGQVKHMYVQLGDQVKKGQIIAKIDSVTQANDLENSAANIKSLQAQRLQQEAQLNEANLEYKRQKAMFAQDATSRASFESADAKYKTALAQLKVIDAQIEQAHLSESTARINLSYTKIIAPMDGTIVAIVTNEGQTVNANQTAPTIVKLAQLNQMTIKAQVSEADIMKIEKGQQVYFTTLGDDKRRYATLRQVEPAPDSITSDSTSTSSSTAIYYNALFDVPNPDQKLRINMTAQVYIVLSSAKDALLVPSAALSNLRAPKTDHAPQTPPNAPTNTANKPQKLDLTEAQKELLKSGQASLSMVRVLVNNTAQPQQVLVGMNNRISAQVLAGLKEGDQVIIADSSDSSAANAKANNNRKRTNTPPPMGM
ncbi:efflux RND transporter periplasmic adaptor subunit [Acinetobacter rathckeae]|uniref:efflux RND transporter periplasmic adaptor subunit n=1 Tax=Acinetobacter rathckeae TaxID=2605272 RepID=UPI0018A329B7|nr:efflux RND transporter periplasmic adaptor subunit [Acinetobacter rathckeae]MBF7687828.1 efflux RND transporter periplasmic adaptor subunit [Acinetobacter rathckeae]MBF7687949.1 efflux RND transporter periplasmic adaptor subunit [Acinetobacter rathckeae]MBF7695998.1 efflux RND transporter periplasmic adaptor subunit [Acinetobacter rathckeae]